MPSDDAVARIIDHLDRRLIDQDRERSKEFGQVYAKLDRLNETTNAAFMTNAIKVAEIATSLQAHMAADDSRFEAVEKGDAKKDGWTKTFFTVAAGAVAGYFSRLFGGEH